MSDSEKYLKGHDLTGDINVPQLDLGGNYISYTSRPASPDSEGIEGRIKTAPDGLFFYADGRWRKTPAYTYNWDDLTENVRFLPINKDITLTDDEKQRLRNTIDIQVATLTLPGLVRGSAMSMTSGAVQITYDGKAIVPQATSQYAGAVRVTESALDGYAPIVTTKQYVDQRITERGTIPPASGDTLGGVKRGGDIADINDGIIIVNKASFPVTPAIPSFGVVHIAPPEFTLTPDSTEYDDRPNEAGIAQYPWLTTVSLTKAIAENKALAAIDNINRNNFIQYTPEGQETPVPGFVRIMPGSGLDIVLTGDHAGDISVQHAGVNTWGNVKIYDGTDAGANNLVPYMSLVLSYVLSLGYLTEVDTATYNSKGILSVHSGRGLTISDAGELSIQYAQADQQGVVKVQPAQSESTVALHTVPTVGLMEDRIPTVISGYYALATLDGGTTGRAGIVRVKCTGDEQEGAPFYVPSYDKMVQYVNSKSGLSTLDVLAVLAGNDSKVIGGSLTVNCYAQFNAGAIFNEVRPTISITTPPNTENPNDILTRAEIEELVSGSGGGGTLPSWVHYDASDSTLEISANEVTLTKADNSEGPATLNTGDLYVNGSIDCQNGSVLATNFMGKVDTSRSYVSFGTYDQPRIIWLLQRDEELGRSDSNTVTINGTLVIDSESYGKSTVKLYGLEPLEASHDIKVTGNLLFDDIDIATSDISNISNVNNLTMTGKLVAGETVLQSPGKRAKRELVTSTIPLVSGALYLISITCQDIDGNWIDDIVDGSLVDAEDAVERAVDIINSVPKINLMYRAVLSDNKTTTTVYAVHYGDDWNGKQLKITFSNTGDPSGMLIVTFLLADGSDQGDVADAPDPLLLVNGNITVEGKIRLTNPSEPGANDLITKSNAEDIVTEATQYPLGDVIVSTLSRLVKDNWIYRINTMALASVISTALVVARRPTEIHVHNSTSPLNPAWPASWIWGDNGVFNTSNPTPTMRANTIAVVTVRKHVVNDSTSYILAELAYELELP